MTVILWRLRYDGHIYDGYIITVAVAGYVTAVAIRRPQYDGYNTTVALVALTTAVHHNITPVTLWPPHSDGYSRTVTSRRLHYDGFGDVYDTTVKLLRLNCDGQFITVALWRLHFWRIHDAGYTLEPPHENVNITKSTRNGYITTVIYIMTVSLWRLHFDGYIMTGSFLTVTSRRLHKQRLE